MQNAFTGTIPLRGDLRIVVRRADSGEVRWRYEIRNCITVVALKSIVNLIAQKSVIAADFAVSYLRVGGYTTGAPVAMVAPVRADINLQLPLPNATTPFTVLLDNATKYLTVSNPYEMKIVASLGTGDLNGYDLTEAGLFIRGGTVVTAPAPPVSPAVYVPSPAYYPEMFARQIHPAIPKSNTFVVDYDWRIAITS